MAYGKVGWVLLVASMSFVGARYLIALSRASRTAEAEKEAPRESKISSYSRGQAHSSRLPLRQRGFAPLPVGDIDQNERWKKASTEAWPEASSTRDALMHATERSMDARGVSIFDCNANNELFGTFKLRFKVDVESYPDSIQSGAWRFAGIREGSPVSATVAACFESTLGGPYRVQRSEGQSAYLDGYVDSIPMVYQVTFEEERAAAE